MILSFFNCLEIPEFSDMYRNVFMMCFCVQARAMKAAPAMKTVAPALTSEVRSAYVLKIIPNCAFSLL